MTLEHVKLTTESKQGRQAQCTSAQSMLRALLRPLRWLFRLPRAKARTAQNACPHPVMVPVLCFSSKGTVMGPRRKCLPWRSQQKPCPGSPKILCCLSGEFWLVVLGFHFCLALVAGHVGLPYSERERGCQALWSQTRPSLKCVWSLSQLPTMCQMITLICDANDHYLGLHRCLNSEGKPRPGLTSFHFPHSISSLTATLHAHNRKKVKRKHPRRAQDSTKKPPSATRTSKTQRRRRMMGKARHSGE